jgi:glucan biosynthesis protein
MIQERFLRLGNGEIQRQRKVQTALAEWVEARPGVWVRRVREWGKG